VRDKIAFVRTLSLPDADFLADHTTPGDRGRLAWLARGLRRRLAAGRGNG
jgi:hypothetical protein